MYTDAQFEDLELEQREQTISEFEAIVILLTAFSSSLETELRSFYNKYGRDGVITYHEARKWVSEKDHRKRLTVLLLALSTSFDSLFADLDPKYKAHLESIVGTEITFFGKDVKADKILSTPWGEDETTWDKRLWKYRDKWTNTLGSDIKLALLRRKPIDEVLKTVDKRVTSMRKILWKLYLTETTAVGSLARQDIFKQLGISKYRFYTRADERTCEECGALHGLIFPISAYEVGVTASPIHAHCRCWEVPIWD